MTGRHARGHYLLVSAVVSVLFCGLGLRAAAAAEGDYHLRIRALVGGSAAFILTADQVAWFQRQGLRPGLSESGGKEEPAFLDGEPWAPEWIGPLSTRKTVSDTLPTPPVQDQTFCRVLSGRGDVRLQVSPYAALVLLDDTRNQGADWYEFEVFTAGSLLAAQAGGADRLLQAEARVPRQAAAGAPSTAGMDARVARQASHEAWLSAQAANSGEYEQLQRAYFAMDEAADNVAGLQRAEAAARQDVAYWQDQVAEAQDKVLSRQRTPQKIHGVTYDYSWNNYWYRNWRARLDDRKRSLQAAQTRLAEATRQLQTAQQRLTTAQAAYLDLRGKYDARFAETYNTQFEELKEDVAERVAAEQDERQYRLQQEVEGRKVPGDYSLIHNGRTLGTITLFEDGTLTTVDGEKRADYQWEVTPDGVLLRTRNVEWLLTPGPEDTWLGRCLGPALEIKGLSAMLKRQ